MSKNKVIKSVGFNITNKQDQELLEHLNGLNFSPYVKGLIMADIQKRNQALKIVQRSTNGGIKIVVAK
jgi:hypothetical protein